MTVEDLTLDVAVPGDEPGTATQLGLPGRIAVGFIVAIGLALALIEPIGLLWFLAFAGVGALLAIRRPQTSIGWLLLALGYAHVLVALPADAGGPLPPALVAFVSGAIWPVVFVLYAALALLLPAGRLPGGAWGRTARVLLLIDLGCVALNAFLPAFGDLVVLPLVAVLIASVVSLVARTVRAQGVERLQLRWIVASLSLVVVALLLGFLIEIAAPGSADDGVAWLPVALAFPTVPISIGVAVMRYRLYEIDTIIHRTIVYGLLTAILAGSLAAAIGVTRSLFEGLVGADSDVTVVITTLIVVAAFNPLKGWLQALVDRRYKEVGDPADMLTSFVDDLRGSPSELSVERTSRAFLLLAVRAFRASGGVITVTEGNGPARSIEVGDASGGTTLQASAALGGIQATLSINGTALPGGVTVLRSALRDVVAELAETTVGSWDSPAPVADPGSSPPASQGTTLTSTTVSG